MNSGCAQTTIPRADTGTTFVQLWQMNSADEQQRWLAAMRANVHLLQRKRGFRSMAPHLSLDGQTVVVYAQWATAADLEAGLTDREVRNAREQLDSFGRPDGAQYRVVDVFPLAGPQNPLRVAVGDGVIHFQLWQVNTLNQASLLSELKERISQSATRAGCTGAALHASHDNTRIVVYTKWDNPAALEQSGTSDNVRHDSSHAAVYRVKNVFLATSARDGVELG